MAHIGEEFRLGPVGFLGAGLLGGVFFRQLRGALLRGAQVGDRRHQAPFAVDQLFLVGLERGDVGADRHVAAVLGAAFADVQPAAVLELRFESPRAGDGRAAGDDLVAHHRLRSGRDHGLIGARRRDVVIGEIVEFLEIRVAQDQAVFRVPQHEGFGNGLDGVAQAHVGGHGLFDQTFLFGDVDGDADQMQARIAGLAHQFTPRAQPDPMAGGMAHAEGMIDRGGARFGQIGGQFVQLQIVRMHQLVDVAEGQQVVLGLEAENVEHGLRPEDAAARQIPVPQAAAAAVERGVDAAANRFVDDVGFTGARRLPVKGKAENQHDETGGRRQRDRQRGEGSPGCKRAIALLHDRQLTERRLEHAHGGERVSGRRGGRFP